MFGSGVPTAEKPQAKRYFLMTHGPNAKLEHAKAWSSYKEYLSSTSLLIPIPPAFYRRVPNVIKKTILLDLPMYHFDEDEDGRQALENS